MNQSFNGPSRSKWIKHRIADEEQRTSNKAFVKRKRVQKRRIAAKSTVICPPKFSMRNAPEAFAKFISDLKEAYMLERGPLIRMDLIDETTPEAFFTLQTIMKDELENYDHPCRYILPKPKSKAKRFWDQCNCNTYLVNRRTSHQDSSTWYVREDNVMPDVEAIYDVVDHVERLADVEQYAFAHNAGFGIELMTNTISHAQEQNLPEVNPSYHQRWHFFAVHRKSENTVTFTFIDNGDGIAKTAYRKQRSAFNKALGKEVSDAKILETIFEDKSNLTMTKLAYHGRGLPFFKERLQDPIDVKNVCVLANRGHGFVDDGVYQELKTEFSGTIITWDQTYDDTYN